MCSSSAEEFDFVVGLEDEDPLWSAERLCDTG